MGRHPSAAKIMVVAGEASGDRHGAALVRALSGLYPNIPFEVFGSGGDELRSAGVETLVDIDEMAVIGVAEIAGALHRLYRAYRTLLTAARRRRPDVALLIDWPDFNLRLARRCHRDGLKTVYYISPQVWAWKSHRIRTIRRCVDKMLVILPFEKEFYKGRGIEVDYVGHPLAGVVEVTAARAQFCKQNHLEPDRPIIALLPGSRHKEIYYHAPLMLEAARLLRSELPGLQFVVPLASTIERSEVETAANLSDVDARIVERDTYNALGHSEFAIIASGTATVEAALLAVPMVIVYKASALNWRLIRPLIRLDTFGMVNLIAGRRVVPELIQHDATPERITAEVREIMSDAARLDRMRRDLAEVRDRLSAEGHQASERAARAVMKVITAYGRA